MDSDFRAPLVLRAIENLSGLKRIARTGRLADFKLGRDHDLLKAGLVVIVVYLLWRTWRGYDWIAASGWTLLAVTVTSTWLLAWYILWPLPLAVVARDRRLLVATLFVQGLFIAHQVSPLFAPVQ